MKKTNAAKLSLIITTILITAMAVGGELAPELKAGLTQIGGHHWTGKSIVSFVTFVFLYAAIPNRGGSKQESSMDFNVMAVVIGSAILMFAYFTAHYIQG
ncbi:MAG: hypothetical protein AB7T49_17730 [Oligoflexales bacterium]